MKRVTLAISAVWCVIACAAGVAGAADWWKPYSEPCTERENVFAFTEKPSVKLVAKDRYEITFAVKGACDVTVAIVDPSTDQGTGRGTVVRHVASGVLGPNAPEPFQKDSLAQKIVWNGKDDLDTYVKEPEKLQVRVSLGLKPVFHGNLGNASPYDIPGWAYGIAGDEGGMYIFSIGHKGRIFLRKFGHDMEYIATLSPPPANLPEKKLEGRGYVEYEPGKRAVHSAPRAYDTVARNGSFIPLNGPCAGRFRPAVSKGWIYYSNGGGLRPTYVYRVGTDGSTDMAGCADRPLIPGGKVGGKNATLNEPCFAASPDGKWVYMVDRGPGKAPAYPVVWRLSTQGMDPAEVFIGTMGKPGSDNKSLSLPCGIECDAKGRIYVADRTNQRVQIYDPDGKHLKTIEVPNPFWVGVHRKNGAVYVFHDARERGEGRQRLTKLSAFPELKKISHFDGIACNTAALDSWSAKPRLWTAIAGEKTANPRQTVRVWEEDGKTFKMVRDFHEEGQRIAGADSLGYWHGSIRNKVAADSLRERVYLSHGKSGWFAFHVPSGKLVEHVRAPAMTDDIAFDKKGYLHAHFNPGGAPRGVGRFDPERAVSTGNIDFADAKGLKCVRYEEVPYDYGIVSERKKGEFKGILDVRDQPGSKHFQDGFGVNMRGDVAEECNIWYVPKYEDIGRMTVEGALGRASIEDALARGRGTGSYTSVISYEQSKKQVAEMEKRGIHVAAIPRMPGVPVSGGTVWTFDATGEIRDKFAVIAGNLINGVHIDEDGMLYLTLNRQRLRDRKVFLAGREGVFGGKSGLHPFMGTYVKTEPKDIRVLVERSPYAPVPLDQKPKRPPEVGGYGTKPKSAEAGDICWVKGAKWFYAGASPIVIQQPCSCYTMRCGLDWFKRSYVIEQYRHSFAVLDTNGNLIVRMGRYGNLDSANGAKSAIPVGGDNIVTSFTENITASDNYACYDDNGERLAVARLEYHAEETIGVGPR